MMKNSQMIAKQIKYKKMAKGGEAELPERPTSSIVAAIMGKAKNEAIDKMKHDDFYDEDFLAENDEDQVDHLPEPDLDVADDDGTMDPEEKLKMRMKKIMMGMK